MFLGILYLIIYPKHEKELKVEKQTERQQFYQTSKKLLASGCQKICIYQGGWEDWIHQQKKTANQAAYK